MADRRPSVDKNRRDHYVPQGYFRGFVDPEREQLSKPLWALDVQRNEWSQRSTSQIAWARGFYDYSDGSSPDATADEAFEIFENRFPQVRDQIRARGYDSWIEHRDLLISFTAMMAARSPLFRTQALSHVSPSLARDPARDVLAKNFSITLMRSELAQRAEKWQQYHWVLGYTTSTERPFVASDQTVGMWGNGADQTAAHEQNDLWLWCPLSWDMCLIASSQPLSAEMTAELRPEHVTEIQILTRRQAAIFIAAPRLLPHLTSLSEAPA